MTVHSDGDVRYSLGARSLSGVLPRWANMLRPIDITVAALTLVSLMPVLLVAIPAMVDYPNHLARMHVLTAAGTAQANPFYEVRNALYPNLAMDLLVPPLARVVGVEIAAKIFLLASQLLIVSGAIALEIATKRRHELAGVAALLVLYSFPFSWGFLNFQFALGVALWGVAAWQYLRGRPLAARLAIHSLFVAMLYVAHLFALGLYAVTIGLIELSHVARGQLLAGAKRLAVVCLPVMAVGALSLAPANRVGNGATEWDLASRLRSVFHALNGYSLEVAALEALAVIAVCYFVFRTGRLALSRTGVWLACGLALLFLVTPFRLLGSAYVDVRVVVAALLIVPAYTMVSAIPARAARPAIAVFIGIALINTAIAAAVWLAYQDDYAKVKASFALIDAPSRVLIGGTTEGPERTLEQPIHHAPTLAVSAKAMVPTLYAMPGMQPVAVVEASRAQAITEMTHVGPVPVSLLASLAGGTDDTRVPRFLRHWAREFDYLYLVGPRVRNPLPERLDELASGTQFVMYRIRAPRTPPFQHSPRS
jgi:hypothetical protein